MQVERQFPDLVEKNGALVRQLEAARSFLGRAGKGPRFVPEQFTLDQRRGDRRAVHGNQRLLAAFAGRMDRARHQFLAGAGLAEDEHRRVGLRNLADVVQNPPQRWALADEGLVMMQGLEFFPQQFGFRGQRLDLLLRFHPIVHVPEDQRREPPAMQLETGERRFGRKRLAFGTTGGEPAGDPARLLAFRTPVQLGDQGYEPLCILVAHESAEILAGHLVRSTAEDFLRGGIHAGDVEPIVQLDDRVHRAAEEPPDFFFPLAHRGFRPQPLEFRGGPSGKDLKDRIDPRLLRNRPPVDDRHVPQNPTVRILEGHTQVADGAGGLDVFRVRKELQNAVGKMYQLGRFDHALARSPGDIDFIVLDPLAVHPKGEGAEAALLGEIFRHPGAVRAERLAKILHQRGKKLLARFRCGPFEDRAQGGVGFEILKRLGGHGAKVWSGRRIGCKRGVGGEREEGRGGMKCLARSGASH